MLRVNFRAGKASKARRHTGRWQAGIKKIDRQTGREEEGKWAGWPAGRWAAGRPTARREGRGLLSVQVGMLVRVQEATLV